MKRRSLFSPAIMSILFLPVFFCNGQQTNTLPNGAQYIGEMKDGKPNGQGTEMWTEGYKYVGGFKDGIENGQGTFTWTDGRKYVGQFRNGRMDGIGKMTFSDGKVEEGLWKYGGIYAGELKGGKPDGQGALTYPDGRHFVLGVPGCGEMDRVGQDDGARRRHGCRDEGVWEANPASSYHRSIHDILSGACRRSFP